MSIRIPSWLRRTWTYCATLRFVEGVSVGAVFLVSLYILGYLVFADVTNATRQRMVQLVQLISDTWKAFLLLLVPMFYRAIRTFIEEVTEFASLKRRPAPPQPATQNPNPPEPK